MINKICIYTTIAFLLGSALVGSGLYIIQRSICTELEDILKFPATYTIFSGCVLQVEGQGDLQTTVKEGMKK